MVDLQSSECMHVPRTTSSKRHPLLRLWPLPIPSPPVVDITKGVNDACSISRTLCS